MIEHDTIVQPKRNHRVVKHDFFGEGKHLEVWQLGWDLRSKIEAKTSVSKKIFNHYVSDMGMNIVLYHVDDDNFYGIHSEQTPTPFFRFKKDATEKYIIHQIDGNTHHYENGEIIAWFDRRNDIWDSVKIQGKSLEEIIQRSYIVNIC